MFDPDVGFFLKDVDPGFESRQYLMSVWAAAMWCGADGLSEALPFLEQLECSTVLGSYGFGWATAE